MRVLLASLPLITLIAACPPSSTSEGEGEEGEGEGEVVFEDIDGSFVVDDVGGSGRDATVFVPDAYDGSAPLPFVLLLGGYGVSGAQMTQLTGFTSIANGNDMLFAAPDGTVDGNGSHFWNASGSCCDFGQTGVDDSGFLRGVIDGARARANVDPARIWVVGHSNGGFMAHRMACDHADVVSAVVSLAGAIDAATCDPVEPVAVLQVHGTADDTVAYNGGNLGVGLDSYPAAVDTVAQWGLLDGCGATPDDGAALDLARDLAGAESDVSAYAGCDGGGAAELWTVNGAGHVINGNAGLVQRLLDFLEQHHR